MTETSIKKLSLIGLGRLGLCICLSFEQAGWDVVGMDISSNRVDSINRRQLQSKEPKVEEYLQASKRFKATDNLQEAVGHANLIYISIAAPSTCVCIIDTENLGKALMSLNELKLHKKHIVICTTIMPNYIEDVAKVLLQDCTETTISYVPDGAMPISYGRLLYGLRQPDMILIGEGSEKAGMEIEAAHRSMVLNNPTICRMNTTSAELTKLADSSFATVKVAYANFVADLVDNTPNADAHDVLNAVSSDSRIQKQFITRGYGFGGPCIPRDNRALSHHAREVGVDPVLLDAVRAANEKHTEFLADKLMKTLALDGSIILDDVAFRQNAKTDVIDESRKIALGLALVKRGVKVIIRDREPVVKLVRSIYGRKFSYEVNRAVHTGVNKDDAHSFKRRRMDSR